MNYKPNEINWKVGDIVIHDADAKKEEMLMKVIDKCDKCKLITTVYLDFNKKYSKRFGKSDRYNNDKKFLHDPKRFGIDISKFNASHFPSNKLFHKLYTIKKYRN